MATMAVSQTGEKHGSMRTRVGGFVFEFLQLLLGAHDLRDDRPDSPAP